MHIAQAIVGKQLLLEYRCTHSKLDTPMLSFAFTHIGKTKQYKMDDEPEEVEEISDCRYDACSTLMRKMISIDLAAFAAILLLALIFLGLRACFVYCKSGG